MPSPFSIISRTALLWLVLLTGQLLAQESALSAGIWYTGANPDFKPFETGYGFAANLEYQTESQFFGRLEIDMTEFRASGPEVGRTEVSDWLEYGIGYQLDSLLKGLYIYASYTDVSATGRDDLHGTGIHLGYQWHWSEKLSSSFQVGQIDTGFFDVQMQVRLNYHLDDNLSVGLRLRDHHDWDLTSYQLGISYQF